MDLFFLWKSEISNSFNCSKCFLIIHGFFFGLGIVKHELGYPIEN